MATIVTAAAGGVSRRHGHLQAARGGTSEREEGAVRRQAEADAEEPRQGAAVRRGDSPTRKELEAEARRLEIRGRSKMGKDELKRAVARAK
jgi:hypothetical protein